MSDLDVYSIWQGIDAEFVAGSFDGRDPDSPEPTANRHPAYRHSWEVARAEMRGKPIPAAFSRTRSAKIEAGGEFISFYDRQPEDAA